MSVTIATLRRETYRSRGRIGRSVLCALILLTCLVGAVDAQTGSMRGFADLHSHQLGNLSLGGFVVAGTPYGRIDQELREATADCALWDTVGCAVYKDGHSRQHATDILGKMLTGEDGFYWFGHEGWPSFRDWPNYREALHQKVHKDMLRRAVDGGLRLMVMFAVESHKGCQAVRNGGGVTDGRDCNDEMASLHKQLDAAYETQRVIDDEAGGAGLGWYRIVTTAAEAKRVIQAGKLAVVLGVENAQLFNCHGEPCDWQAERHLASLWDKGVRHFFPIHQGNNAFGGASYFSGILQNGPNLLGVPAYQLPTRPCAYAFKFECNTVGLTPTGRGFISRLMDLGAIVDMDHMSDLAAAETLAIAEQKRYPGVSTSHAGFNEINLRHQDHEGQLSALEAQKLASLGGMIGLISGPGNLDTVSQWRRPDTYGVNHTCGNSTETFAQTYLYARWLLPGRPIALGTDFNGPLRQLSPRFGSQRCDNRRDFWKKLVDSSTYPRLQYPFVSRVTGELVYPLVTGNRTWDFNEDGLAHVGMLPDMLADLEVLGIPPADLEPLFTAAEGYVTMWEAAEKRASEIRMAGETFKDGRTGWSGYAPDGSTFTAAVVSRAETTGDNAVLMQDGGIGLSFEDFTGLVPGQSYVVRAKVARATYGSVEAELSAHNTLEGNVARVTVTPQGYWSDVRLLYRADDTGQVRVHLVRGAGTGELYWDDVSIVPTVAIEGRVRGTGGVPLPGVAMAITGHAQRQVTTAADGRYTFADLEPGLYYAVAPAGADSGLAPCQRVFNTLDRIERGADFFTDASARHRLGGTVTTTDGRPVSGVSLRLTGGCARDATTDAMGAFVFTGLPAGGSYAVERPVSRLYEFSPTDFTFGALAADATNLRFVATPQLHSIAGAVKGARGVVLANVKLTLAGPVARTTWSDGEGQFRFDGLPADGSYTLTPSLAGYSFEPQVLSYTGLPSPTTSASLYGTLTAGFAVSGRVLQLSGEPLSGVDMTLSGPTSLGVRTDRLGVFTFANVVPNADYTLIPCTRTDGSPCANHAAYFFAPSRVPLGTVTADRTVPDMLASKWAVAGTVQKASAGLSVFARATQSPAFRTAVPVSADGTFSMLLPRRGTFEVSVGVSDQQLCGSPTRVSVQDSVLPRVSLMGCSK